MTVELRHLRYLAAVADAGQVSRAARTLYMTQPSLSQALLQLERDVGVTLLRRHPRGVELTDAGEAFLVRARSAIRAVEEATEAARRAGERGRHLRVGVLAHTVSAVPRQVLDRFACALPDVRVELFELDYLSHTAAVIDGTVDAAFLWPPYREPGLALLPLAEEPRLVGVATRHRLADARRLALADILDETFAGFHPACSGGWFSGWFFDSERDAPARLTPDETTTPYEMGAVVMAGRGVAPAAASFAASFVVPGVRWIPLDGAPPATLAVGWRPDDRRDVVAAFVDAAAQVRDGALELT